MTKTCRNLVLVLGDQLDAGHPALADADPAQDEVVFIECREESTHVWTHKQRIAVFLSAMRHYADALRRDGWTVHYLGLDDGLTSIVEGLDSVCTARRPAALWLVQPGEYRLLASIQDFANAQKLGCRVFEDEHFYVTPEEFADWANDGRKRLTMEYFYRSLRQRFDILMDDGKPAGGDWNYDADNRQSFPKSGPEGLPQRLRFDPDETTVAVLNDIERYFPEHPGSVASFGWPVTRAQALEALEHFIDQCLPNFGRYQDAMWQDEPFLYHALLGNSLNLKLLNPREVIDAVESAWRDDPDRFPIAAVEGFIRQILGWREFIRGVYWLKMPGYKDLNHFEHMAALPEWFWTGDTPMNCLAQSVGDTLENAYAHHIQRLMVIGNYATLAGLLPSDVCDWFLAVYVDAVEWVELPNVLGMALHGDGGVVGTKPYVASGSYINKMSNYCKSCQYKVTKRSGDDACPFNALYWDFLATHRKALSSTPRMRMVMKNLDRWDADEVRAIRETAERHRTALSER